MANTILSVVIPTYNRYKYLKGCLESVSSIESDEFEIIVHDNTEDNREILSVISKINDPRIRYYHVKEHISVVENSDLGVGYASGDYICMIGDDDTICSSMIDAAHFCKENRIDACMALIPGYNWQDMTFTGEAEPNLFYTRKADGSVRIIEAKEILLRAIKTAEGLPGELPRIYHGLVSRECLDRIRKVCGTFFPGPSPDMANATAVSLQSKKTVFISDYLMVSGYGYQSARGEGNRKEHFGEISEKPWLPKDTEDKWNKDIPKLFSGETIFAQSLLSALKAMGETELIKKYNYGSLYAQFLSHHRSTFTYMLKFCMVRPYRIAWIIRGIFERLRIRKELLSQAENKYYYQVPDVNSLNDAQRITNKLRKELDSGDYHWE